LEGQVLAKASDTDFDIEWVDVLPEGGSEGMSLLKASDDDFDVGWDFPPGGGAMGDTLIVKSTQGYDLPANPADGERVVVQLEARAFTGPRRVGIEWPGYGSYYYDDGYGYPHGIAGHYGASGYYYDERWREVDEWPQAPTPTWEFRANTTLGGWQFVGGPPLRYQFGVRQRGREEWDHLPDTWDTHWRYQFIGPQVRMPYRMAAQVNWGFPLFALQGAVGVVGIGGPDLEGRYPEDLGPHASYVYITPGDGDLLSEIDGGRPRSAWSGGGGKGLSYDSITAIPVSAGVFVSDANWLGVFIALQGSEYYDSWADRYELVGMLSFTGGTLEVTPSFIPFDPDSWDWGPWPLFGKRSAEIPEGGVKQAKVGPPPVSVKRALLRTGPPNGAR
jgi:hypothetical protein